MPDKGSLYNHIYIIRADEPLSNGYFGGGHRCQILIKGHILSTKLRKKIRKIESTKIVNSRRQLGIIMLVNILDIYDDV